MKTINGTHLPPSGLRVAIVVTKAPSEPFSLVKTTLEGALFQRYPHDTWVADEHPSEEALIWYKEWGVRVSCRKDDPAYHNDEWPRRKKCKEGNLAYFYDKYGYENYDVVVQMDADHQAQKDYLEEILKPFQDKSVGYVAAPSVCDTNRNKSWSARARMHSEAIFHGPIQSGQNDGWVPTCIGSHYAVRTKALKEIGGIGPELAEDYATTLLLNASGWKGVLAYTADARGEGPNSFKDLIIQDYQWARSLNILLLTLYPKLWKRLNWRQRAYFTFTQLWYGLSSFVWLAGLLLIVIALLSGHAPVIINFIVFLRFALIPCILAFIILSIAELKGLFRPDHAHFLSWESVLFELARWPWVFIACFDVFLWIFTKKTKNYIVTSKNKASSEKMPINIITPYLATSILLILAVFFKKHTVTTAGYEVFALIIASCYLVLSLIVLVLHIKEIDHPHKIKLTIQHLPHFISVLGLILLTSLVIFKFYYTAPTLQIKTIPQLTSVAPATTSVQNTTPFINGNEQSAASSSSDLSSEYKDQKDGTSEVFP